MNSRSIEDIVGLHILRAHAEKRDGDVVIYLGVRDRIWRLRAIGDCCANAFFQHVDCAEALQNATVTKVEDLKHTKESRGEYGDITDIWGHRIHTTRGICTLDMRTEHNGYYSGWIEVDDEVEFIPVNAKVLKDF